MNNEQKDNVLSIVYRLTFIVVPKQLLWPRDDALIF